MKRREFMGAGFLFFLMIGVTVAGRPLESLDELWQYSYGSNLARGCLPYRDVSMVTTPLSQYVNAAAIRIFGDQLLVYRCLGIILCTFIMLLFYHILLTVGVDKRVGFCFSVYVCVFYSIYYTFDYNYLVLLFLLAMMDLMLHSLWRHVFALGVLAGCGVMTKQSTGFVLLGAVTLLLVLFRKEGGKAKWLKYGTGCLLPVAVCLIWLAGAGVWTDFVDYAFGGLKSFAGQNRVTLGEFFFRRGVLCTLEGVLWVVILAASVRKLFFAREKRQRQRWMILLGLSAAGMAVIYPITDEVHFLAALFPFLILGIYALPPAWSGERHLPGGVLVFVAGMGLFASAWQIRGEEGSTGLKHLRGIRIAEEVAAGVEAVDAYLASFSAERPVYILDGAAVLYKIPMDLYDKDFDLCIAGNWGGKDAEEVAEALLETDGIMLLASDGYGVNWQVPEAFLDYIKKEAVCIDQIGKYDVYIRK